jgi:hypothetical protein
MGIRWIDAKASGTLVGFKRIHPVGSYADGETGQVHVLRG